MANTSLYSLISLYILKSLALPNDNFTSANTIPPEAIDYGFGQIIPYQILYNNQANDTQIQQIINTLGNAIVTVFSNNGFDDEHNNIHVAPEQFSVIRNHPGDMVVQWGQTFDEKDKPKIVSLTNSSQYATQINEYFKQSNIEIVNTANVIVLINEFHFYYIYKEEGSIWTTSNGIAIAVILIVFVLTAVIGASVWLHCRKRREDYETKLPKSKAHKQRVLYLQKYKENKKEQRRKVIKKYTSKYGNIFKYKTIRQDSQMDEENENDEETDNEIDDNKNEIEMESIETKKVKT